MEMKNISIGFLSLYVLGPNGSVLDSLQMIKHVKSVITVSFVFRQYQHEDIIC
jgi:hypothetical protein